MKSFLNKITISLVDHVCSSVLKDYQDFGYDLQVGQSATGVLLLSYQEQYGV